MESDAAEVNLSRAVIFQPAGDKNGTRSWELKAELWSDAAGDGSAQEKGREGKALLGDLNCHKT